MCYKWRTKHCVANRPHLFEPHLCLNHPTPHILCSRQPHNLSLVTLLLDHWALAHFQPHPASHLHISCYHKHPPPDLRSKTQRLRHHSLFPANERTQKHSFTCASFTSMVVLLNSAQNRTRSHGSCHIFKPVQHEHGKNMSWLKFLRRLSGTTQQMSSCKRSNINSVIWTNMQQCHSKFAL